jgi:C_GCAxxG_C_C family probable redox protein
MTPQYISNRTAKQDVASCIKHAAGYGLAGSTCAESVALAFASILGMSEQDARRIVSGLAGGIGGHGATCGTVTAAVCMLGWHYGPKSFEDMQARRKALLHAGEFMDRFVRRHGTTTCRELCTAGNPSTPEGAQAIKESGMPLQLIRSASEILVEVLQSEGRR